VKKQHSVSATYVLIENGSNGMMFHPRDPASFSEARSRTEPEGELTLYPSLESALHTLDREANEFFEDNPNYVLQDIKQFHAPGYELPIFNEGLPGMAKVSDVTRVLIYTNEK